MKVKKYSLWGIAVLLVVLTLLLSTACGTPTAATSTSASVQPSSAVSEPQSTPAATEAPAPKADRYTEIFDTSNDAGKLTVRFLKLVSTDPETKAGDSAILTFPDGKVMLIDAGNATCSPIVSDALKAMGVTKLDAVVNSHPHVDHCGGLKDILNDFPVDMVYKNDLKYPKGPAQDFEGALAKNDLPVTVLKEGDSFSFGGAEIKVYNPPAELVYPEKYPESSTQFVNNTSLLMHITYGSSTVLFGGDLYTPGENRLIELYGDQLQADVMKANHHGDSTSNSRSYIEAVSPKICVMMHDAIASMDVYKAYRKAGADTYLTFVDGCVKVTADDAKNYTVVTQFDRQNDFLK